MFIYSGKCRLCEVGIPTGKKDCKGMDLYTGDLVVVFSVGEDGILDYVSENTSPILIEQYTSVLFANEVEHIKLKEPSEPYAMGIKTEGLDLEDSPWNVMKIKDHKEIVENEKWSSYSLTFKNE